jgi:hypothetical protein
MSNDVLPVTPGSASRQAGSSRVTMRLAGVASLASSGIAAVAVILLVAMYGAFAIGSTSIGLALGGLNDRLTLVAYALAVPGVLATVMVLSARPLIVAFGALAIVAIAAIAVLQWQLIIGALSFEEQIGPVSVAFLVLGSWFVLTGYFGTGVLPYGVRLGVLAALYVGYPLLALRLGRSLRAKG